MLVTENSGTTVIEILRNISIAIEEFRFQNSFHPKQPTKVFIPKEHYDYLDKLTSVRPMQYTGILIYPQDKQITFPQSKVIAKEITVE